MSTCIGVTATPKLESIESKVKVLMGARDLTSCGPLKKYGAGLEGWKSVSSSASAPSKGSETAATVVS